MRKTTFSLTSWALQVGFATCLALITTAILNAKNAKQPLRIDLAENAKSAGYSLADLCWVTGDQANIVDFSSRSSHSVRIGNIVKPSECADTEEKTNLSPDGKWSVLQEGEFYVLLDRHTQTSKKLFPSKDAFGVRWSPDSRYFSYVKPGGNGLRPKFWEIGCPDSYRVWVWRIEDGEHDWVYQICKPGRPMVWIMNSDLLTTQS